MGAPVTLVDPDGVYTGAGTAGGGPTTAQLPASLGAKASAASLSVTPATDAVYVTGGNVAAGATNAGNPVWIGGLAADPPTAVTAGQRGGLQTDTRSRLHVTIGPTNSTLGGYERESLDTIAVSSSDIALRVNAFITAFDGSTNKIRMRGDANGLVTQVGLSSTFWQYAGATGGIVNTSDNALKTAAGAGVRNYLDSIQFKNTAAVASEIVVKDGSTIIWRGQVGASMTFMETINFIPPLKGSANTALNVALLTTATATIVSAQGHTGS